MLYPLKFEPVYKDYIWGGRELEKLGKKIPDGIVAESWEISSHHDGECIVSNGEYKGMHLSKLIKKLGRELIGTELPEKDVEKFPLLIKFIDANDRLSVQVHPDDEYAKIHENGELGKNEMWYIISAKPGSQLVYGVADGVTKEIFAKHIKENKIETCLNYIDVSSGDAFNIPAGLVHAIGAGILIAEIQQNSNTTYRVFDYNRTDKNGNKRPLRIEKALDVINYNNCNIKGKLIEHKVNLNGSSFKSILAVNKYFSVERYVIDGVINEEADGSKFQTYTCLNGEGEIKFVNGTEKIVKGESVLIPANMGIYTIKGKLELIKSYAAKL
ncbi:MAG: mannose-6-phosphate isomerase, class I [Bacillota bacterium]|nr:mannose-6-phosphate isomerase, class I [Bacillota bacterium]